MILGSLLSFSFPLFFKIGELSMKSTKAQAATEFLTTYGWSFLIVLSVLGLMIYFGLTSSSDRLPSKCDFDKSFQCTASIALADGSYAFEFVNQESGEIVITKALCSFPQTENSLLIDYTRGSNPIILGRGDSATIVCDPDPIGADITIVNKERFQAKVVYEENIPGALPSIANLDIISGVSQDSTDIFTKYYVADSLYKEALCSSSCYESWS